MNSNTTILDNPKTREKCQRFTPESAVKEMLALAGYVKGNDIVGKKVLEHSFGNGNIIVAIVEEYIQDAINNKMSKRDISYSLSQDVYGFELDKQLYQEAVKRLNETLKKYDIPGVKWKLYNEDVLFWEKNVKFDYIIGNPPYVTYSEIDAEIRDKIRSRFSTCEKGKFDYCYAFIEFSVERLTKKGKLVHLIPNNVYKNVYAKSLRDLIKGHIKQINVYPAQKLFHDVLTSTSIFLYDVNYNDNAVFCINKTNNSQCVVSREKLSDKWVLTESSSYENRLRFGDYFNAANTVATLLNEAFLVSKETAHSLEQDIVRPAVSPKSLHFGKDQYIIFPYFVEGQTIIRFSDDDFLNRFPKTFAHLEGFREKLISRKSDSNARWFEYGRSQALRFIDQKKLLVSTVITNSVAIYSLDEQTIPYSGIYIIPKRNISLEVAKKILMSDDFMNYIQQIGISVNGSSIRITCKDINNYMFFAGELNGTA